MAQLVTRVSDELATEIDEAVAAGQAANRSELVRRAVVELLARQRHDEMVRHTLEAYRRQPQTDEEVAWADAAGRALIAEEPW